MADELIKFGDSIAEGSSYKFTIEAAGKTRDAIDNHQNFTLLDICILDDIDRGLSEILIAECSSDRIPSKNKMGIKYSEILALRFFKNKDILPEVRALRKDFPAIAHTNHVIDGEPQSLCLYFDLWSAIERTWTPQKHLNRILWWLEETSKETLHRSDQPVEQVYFESPFSLVLPPNFDENISDENLAIALSMRPLTDVKPDDFRILCGSFVPKIQLEKENYPQLSCVDIKLNQIVGGLSEREPYSLGQLDDQLSARGAPLASSFFEEIKKLSVKHGLKKFNNASTLLILSIPICREEGGQIEKTQRRGFIVNADITELGVKAGALQEIDDLYYQVEFVSGAEEITEWRDITISPLELLSPFTKELAKSVTGNNSDGPKAVLAGVGALGSEMLNLWIRSGWGEWTIIDQDHLKPHNLSKHTTYEFQLGNYKVTAAATLALNLYQQSPLSLTPISGNVNNFTDAQIAGSVDAADLIVDATTTLDAPRDLSQREGIKRICSTFLTPNGLDSVILFEDSDRTYRLDSLESQYYRAIISNSWGETHLKGHGGQLSIGAGCRDISSIIPNELVTIHAANLARQVQQKSQKPNAIIQVWHYEQDTGAIKTYIHPPSVPISYDLDTFSISWDESLRSKIRQLRTESLPDETGGIILGYFDLKSNIVYVVDVLAAPEDSQGDPSGFSRGNEGLLDKVKIVEDRTAGIVTYLGEWHSHPSGAAALPSVPDLFLIGHLAKKLQADGFPALMLIVGEHEENWIIAEALN